MTRKTWYWIHKWISIVVGLFLFVWLVSGVVMILPDRWFQPVSLVSPSKIDYSNAQVSPQEAIERIENAQGEKIEVSWVSFAIPNGRLAYRIQTATGPIYMVDAITGEQIKIDEETARQIAQQGRGGEGAAPERVELIKEHDLIYPYGPLPVFRVVFDRQSNNIFYVSTADGSLSVSSRGTRLRSAITSLHTFEPLKLIVDSERMKKGLLVALSLVGIGTTITGYILAVLPLLRRRNRVSVYRPND